MQVKRVRLTTRDNTNTHEADTNRGTHLFMLGVDNPDATDTIEADTLKRKRYNFLTAGRTTRTSPRGRYLALRGNGGVEKFT
jgi:hypothetical protein